MPSIPGGISALWCVLETRSSFSLMERKKAETSHLVGPSMIARRPWSLVIARLLVDHGTDGLTNSGSQLASRVGQQTLLRQHRLTAIRPMPAAVTSTPARLM